MIVGQQLLVDYSKNMRTISLLDEFEQRKANGDIIYQSILIGNCFTVQKSTEYSVSLILARWDWRKNFINDFMTFTRFKKLAAGKCFTAASSDTPAVVQQVLNGQLTNNKSAFPLAVLLHAQNSGNRRGYGNSSSCPGTRYGETNTYMFTGAILKAKGE